MRIPNKSKMKRGKGSQGIINNPEEDEDIKPGWRKGIVKRQREKSERESADKEDNTAQ